jgi:5-formyltetrahydrofolate cyclo-ligase
VTQDRTADTKAVLRAQLRAARAARSAADRGAAAEGLAGRVEEVLSSCGTAQAGRVAAFVGVGDEPDTRPLLIALADAGRHVVLPVLLPDRTLRWAPWAPGERLATARFGLREPTGPAGPLPSDVALILVPALAVDRRGGRLGQGGGSYDRTLASLPPGVPVVAVTFDDEVLPQVPTEPHDVRVTAVLTPSGLIELPGW